jgi:HPt (histidine-containing phosphotransfer) domain-containing protein
LEGITLTEKTQRIEEIIKRTRIAFTEDTINKVIQIQGCFQQWKDNSISQENLIDTTHRNVHSIKGLALTLSYPLIHNACEQILDIILQHESPIWTTTEINCLHILVDQLQTSMDESFVK